MPNLEFRLVSFAELTTLELYALLRLRSEVFVVEQNCIYQDVDDFDQEAYHLLGFKDDELLAYTRLLKPGAKYPSASLGRVVNHSKTRGTGLGRMLVEEAIARCSQLWPNSPITISAQLYLERFYAALGFQTDGEAYLEDDIPHIQMHLNS